MRQSVRDPNQGPGVRRPKEGIIPNPQSPLREQVREVLRFHHYARLPLQLLCGTGLRVIEMLRLRVKDLQRLVNPCDSKAGMGIRSALDG